MTQHFYKATVSSCIKELIDSQDKFINSLNSIKKEGSILQTYAPFKIAKKNYPFASYLTNLNNTAMFNNGTIHIYVTLPTGLDEHKKIENRESFKEKHKNLAKIIQWISPLLIAKYGAADPLSLSLQHGNKYATGSQRIAASRYVGLATYDTEIMESGKILTKKLSELSNIDWYYNFHKYTDYKLLDYIGMDINYNKHYCHGIEIRFFESMPIRHLEEVMRLIVYLCDYSLNNNNIENPKKNGIYHNICENCVHNGKAYMLSYSEQKELLRIFNINTEIKEPLHTHEMLQIIIENLQERYVNKGICTQLMIEGKDITSVSLMPLDIIQPELNNNSDKTESKTELNNIKVQEVKPRKYKFLCF
jgi:hypothetical protein